MFDLPYRHWINFVHLAIIAGGARLAYKFPTDTFEFIGSLIATSGFVMIAGNTWGVAVEKSKELSEHDVLFRAPLTETELREQARRAMEARNQPERVPQIKVDGRPLGMAYSQTLAPVKVDIERAFCQTLVDMKRGGFEMDVSETYWLKGGRWQGTPTEFKEMRAVFEYYHIVGKRGNASNSPYVVLNEEAVERKAEGKLRLPRPNGL